MSNKQIFDPKSIKQRKDAQWMQIWRKMNNHYPIIRKNPPERDYHEIHTL